MHRGVIIARDWAQRLSQDLRILYLVRMSVIVHVEFQHTSDQQLGLHDPVTDQPKVTVLFRRLDGPVQGAVHNADQVSDAHRFIFDLGGQVDGRGGDQLPREGDACVLL